jgi:hypothetical protein
LCRVSTVVDQSIDRKGDVWKEVNRSEISEKRERRTRGWTSRKGLADSSCTLTRSIVPSLQGDHSVASTLSRAASAHPVGLVGD